MTVLAVAVILFGVCAVTPDGTGLVQGLDSVLSRAVRIGGFRPTQLPEQFGTQAPASPAMEPDPPVGVCPTPIHIRGC